MKKQLLIVVLMSLLSLSVNKICGQSVWFQDGTTWVHSCGIPLENLGGFYQTTIEKDTIIDGIECKKFSSYWELFDGFDPSFPMKYSGTGDPFFMYASKDNEQVFYYQDGEFKLLYDFTLQPGELLTMPFPESIDNENVQGICPNTSFLVDSIGVQTINGQELKWISVSTTSESNYFMSGKIYQKIGPTNYHFLPLVLDGFCNILPSDFTFVDEFRCYSDNLFGSYKKTFVEEEWEGNCYFPGIDPTVTATSKIDNLKIRVYPNPVNNYLHIENIENKIDEVYIINMFGVIETTIVLDPHINTIDLQSLDSGMYFLKFSNAPEIIKFVKEYN